jgi:nucleotide-binding universal stress UspA family protein
MFMKKILVPCDFSKPAISAFRLALDVAKQSRGVVHLLNIIELPVLHDSILMPVLNFEQELLNDMRKGAEAKFKKLIEKYNTDNLKIKVIGRVEFGNVFKSIQDYVKEFAIDLVVMGSHGTSGVRELLIGSNAEKVVRRSLVPVLVSKDYYKGPIKNIVFPNTLETEEQEDLVMKVKALQNFFKAKLHIVWVNTPLNFTADTETRKRLEAFAKRFMFRDYTINVFNHTDEEFGIIQFASSIKAELIAMGTHGRKGFAHMVIGSLAEDVVNHNSGLVWTYSMKREKPEFVSSAAD